MTKPLRNLPMRHKHKRYQSYLLESAEHNKSIMNKYGASPKAQPPILPQDMLERVLKQIYVTPEMWNGSI